jgi:hypothetical protein
MLQSACLNCDDLEKQLLKLFREKYVSRVDIGREYFEGDGPQMMFDINETIRLEAYRPLLTSNSPPHLLTV